MSTQNLLVELFVEELPPKALKKLGEAFAGTLFEQLKTQGLTADDSVVTPYASPRRLAAHITHVAAKAADKAVQQKLMPVSVALDAQGQPTPALLKKLQAVGADPSVVPTLKRQMDGKAEALFLDTLITGATLDTGLQKALNEAIAKLPIPKVMTYQLQEGTPLPGWDSVQFVRPAHGLVALHGDKVVPVTALGLTAGRATHGHRFEAVADPIAIVDADRYADTLRDKGAVIASFDERRAAIESQLRTAAAQAGQALAAIEDEALLDEVTALVERPNVLVCAFEKEFLDVPQECLILTMKANQKYFPLLDAKGKLTNQFLVVSNISPKDASAVIEGNERVVRPRLADAKFFFDQDRRKTLESRVPQLAKVVYHNKLGTQGERVERVRAIARAIGQQGVLQLRADGCGDDPHALGAFALRAQLVVIDHLGQLRHTVGQRLLAVLVEEEFGVGQARAHHALVALDDGAGIVRGDVADDQELVRELALGIEQGKVFLVGLHGEDEAFLRHGQKFFFKLADEHVGALNQGGDFVQQRFIFDSYHPATHFVCSLF